MKSVFLDLRNCLGLLPQGHGLRLAQRLDECLRQLNNKQGILYGSIDMLVRRNETTRGRTRASERLCNSPLEVGQASFLANGIGNTQAIERGGPGPARLHTVLVYENGTTRKTTVPLQFLLKGWGDANDGHQCYVHTISRGWDKVQTGDHLRERLGTDSSDDYYYVGITGRNWLARLDEHFGEMRRDNRRKFYRIWRESLGMSDVHYISTLMEVNLTYEDAMNWEEVYVDRIAHGPNGLNMIPGGFKGLKLLHTLRIIDRMDISLEDRERAIADYIRRNPRKGIPNPFIAELWKDDEFYLKNIEAKERNLRADQVRKIRELASTGRSIADIREEVGARNELQVKNVITGRYYHRIR
jgi:hypothetical protein